MIKFKQGDAPIRFTTLMAIAFALVFGQTQALAAKSTITEKSRAAGMAEAPSLITTGNIPCELVDANFAGEANVKVGDKNIKGKLYEISCKNAPGWMVTKTDGGIEPPYNCTQGAAYVEQNKGVPVCELPSNIPHYKWLQSYATSYMPNCTVDKARLIGTIKSENIADRYEVGCANENTIVIDIPSLGSKATVEYRNCLMTEGTASACKYQTHEQALAQIQTYGQQADANCQMNNGRFIGITADLDGYYYEIGCSNQPGFVVLINKDNSFHHSVSCTAARSIGGCQFTDLSLAASAESQFYTNTLSGAGIACNVTEFNVIGSQPTTKRDYVEFKCAEKPFGLIGFVPQEGSQSNVNVSDCFIDKVRKNACGFVKEDVLKAHIDKLIKVALPTRNCDVSEVRYIGEADSEADGIILEVACANKRGYIGFMPADRSKISNTIPCKIAKAHNDEIQCEIAGNGTYAENE